MRIIIILILLHILLLLGCEESTDNGNSSQACSESSVIGTWVRGTDTMEILPSCLATSSLCESQMQFPNVSSNSGDALVTVQFTNGESVCLPVGEHTCSYELGEDSDGEYLNINCAGTWYTYDKS